MNRRKIIAVAACVAVCLVLCGEASVRREACLFWSAEDGSSPAATIETYRQLRMKGIPSELHAVNGTVTPEQRKSWLAMYERQMNLDGKLADKISQRVRFPNDEARRSYEKQPIWPEGHMPHFDPDQCTPYLEWHMPKRLLSRVVMIVYSGGGYSGNSTDGNSVPPIRRFLNEKGVAVVTLKYRSPWPKKLAKHMSAWADLQRTIRLVRRGAAARGLDPRRIGLCGGSAGGHLSLLGALSSTQSAYESVDDIDRESCNVQFAVALFPAYILTDGLDGANKGGGNDPKVRIADEFAFDAKTCPVLFLHGDADGYSAMGSVRVWERLQAMGVRSELHTFALQPHDFQYAGSPGTGAYAYLDFIWSFVERCSAAELTFGVLSDVHIDGRHFNESDGGQSVRVFKMALEHLRERRVDGIVICGDLTQDGQISELKRFAAVWNEVFPGDRRPDGGHVERLFIFGDHDVEKPYLYLKYWPEKLKDPKVIADLTKNHIAYVDRAKVWRDVFHEAFAPIRRVNVKGYDFVLAHLVNADEDGLRYADPLHIPGLEEFFATNRFDATKPFFYVQHKIPRGTVGGRFQSGQDAGRTTAILSRYPNAVGFCGHKHRTATEELSLWQGAFTQIQSPALATLLTAAGRENSRCSCEPPCATPPQQMEVLDTWDGSQALVVTVDGNRMIVERIDMQHGGEPVAEPWIVRLPNDGSASYERRGAGAPVPQFPAGATVKTSCRLGKDRAGAVTNQIAVSFPPARSTATTPRAYDYEVTAVLSKGVVTRIVSQKRVYSPKCYWPERLDTNDVVCVFGQAEIPDNHESVKFVVRPMNAWGKPGEPIESAPAAYWAKGPLYPF